MIYVLLSILCPVPHISVHAIPIKKDQVAAREVLCALTEYLNLERDTIRAKFQTFRDQINFEFYSCQSGSLKQSAIERDVTPKISTRHLISSVIGPPRFSKRPK